MTQGTKPAEDYQKHVDSVKQEKGREENVQEKLRSDTNTKLYLDDNVIPRNTEPMSFLEDLDKDIGRKFPKAHESHVSDKFQPINGQEVFEMTRPDDNCNLDDYVKSDVQETSCTLSSAQANIAKISSQQSNYRQKSFLKQASNSKIPKPVRSQKSNSGIQQPGSKVTNSCRTVPVTDRNTTQHKRQRQTSVGPGGRGGIFKHSLQNALKDGKRDEVDMESYRSRIKPSQSSPIRKYEALDVILPAKKGDGENRIESGIEEPEILQDLEYSENKAFESRNEYLYWLSKAISDKRLNIVKLDECFSNLKFLATATNSPEEDAQATRELETKVLQKLIKKVSDLYENCQSHKIANSKLQNSFELAHNSDLKKILLLESENQDLISSMETLSRRLEEERVYNDKMKRGSQTIPMLKKKIRDVEQRLKNWDDKQREQVLKLKSLEANCKLKNLDNVEKELKNITTEYEKLVQKNENLKKELQKSKEQENLKLSKMIDNSDEMNDMRAQISNLRMKYNEELNKGKRYLTEQHHASLRMQEMELKSRNLSHQIDEAKKEIKSKNHEFEEYRKAVEADKQMLRTELNACKVTKQGTIDENAMLRGKIEQLQSRNEKVHSLEKENLEMEQQLRTDLALRDEQIMQLQEQIKCLLGERKNYLKDINDRVKGKKSLDQCQIGQQERTHLAAQVIDLQKNVDELAHNNIELQKLLADRNAELEQRDQIVKLQTDVLKIRDELIELLRNKDSKHEKHVEELSSILMEREHAIEKVKKNISSYLHIEGKSTEPHLIRPFLPWPQNIHLISSLHKHNKMMIP